MADNVSAQNSQSTERLAALVARLGADDLARSLGGGWTVGFALAHLAFWDARHVAALQRFAAGDGFPSEDYAANAALELIAGAFNPATVAEAALSAARQLDAVVDSLSATQRSELEEASLTYAIARAPHRDEHIQQIEGAMG